MGDLSEMKGVPKDHLVRKQVGNMARECPSFPMSFLLVMDLSISWIGFLQKKSLRQRLRCQ